MGDTKNIIIGIVVGVATAVIAQAVIKAVGLRAQQAQQPPQTIIVQQPVYQRQRYQQRHHDYDHTVIRW